jgi:hypothetical protein
MIVQLSPSTTVVLQRYAEGQFSNRELSEWLVQVEYDLDVPPDERDELGQLRLTVIEVSEGLRPADHILEGVAALLAPSEPEGRIETIRSSSSTNWRVDAPVTEAASPVQHVGIAP